MRVIQRGQDREAGLEEILTGGLEKTAAMRHERTESGEQAEVAVRDLEHRESP
jgi:hypothetical protein